MNIVPPEVNNSEHVELPQVNFSTFIMSLASSAMVHLGEVPNPETGKTAVNLQLATHTIEILEMLQEKTAPTLTDKERMLIKDILYELRMKYLIHKK